MDGIMCALDRAAGDVPGYVTPRVPPATFHAAVG
jgi:hypothetical protein